MSEGVYSIAGYLGMHTVSEGGRVVNQGATTTPTFLSRALAAGMQVAGFHGYDGPNDLWRRALRTSKEDLWFSTD